MGQRIADAPPHATPARDEDVVGQSSSRKVDCLECFARAARPEPFVDHGREAGYHRREHHRDDRHVERERIHVVADGAAREPDTRQHECELPNLKERQADGKRHDVPVAKRPDHAGQDRGLADDDGDDNERKGAELLPDERRVEQHPDRDEEQHPKEIPQWHDVTERLVRIFGLIDHETSHECAERHRQPE